MGTKEHNSVKWGPQEKDHGAQTSPSSLLTQVCGDRGTGSGEDVL